MVPKLMRLTFYALLFYIWFAAVQVCAASVSTIDNPSFMNNDPISIEITSDEFNISINPKHISGLNRPIGNSALVSQTWIPHTWQHAEVWCWAASIQMVLNYHGIPVSQEEIVTKTYGVDRWGRPLITGASDEAITQALNKWAVDTYGNRYRIIGLYSWGSPNEDQLIQQIIKKKPVIIGYETGGKMRHAVVISGIDYSGNRISSVIIRDPWPSKENFDRQGRQERARDFLKTVTAYWYIDVYRQ